MAVKYYGWIGAKGYNGVVKVKDMSEAHILTKAHKEFHRNDEYLKAVWDPGSEFDEITEVEAKEIMEKIQNEE